MPGAARASSDDVESLVVRGAELASRISGWPRTPRRCRGRRTRFERLSAAVRYVIIETDGGERHAPAGNGSAAMRGGETGAFPVARSQKPTGILHHACVRERAGGGEGEGEGPARLCVFNASVRVAPGTRAGFISTLMSQLEAAGPPRPPRPSLPHRDPSSGTGPECPLR